MKKIFLLLVFILILIKVEAQVLINLQLPATGLTIKSQLWNFSLVNTGPSNINVRIDLTFTDINNNQVVFTASSKTLVLLQPITVLQANSLVPIIYNVVNNNYSVDASPDGFLPIGTYEVCYAIMKANGDVFEKVAEDCEIIDIEPISPPVLIDPADEDSIYQVRPFFTWVPPVPALSFNNLTYDWLLVEVDAFQNPADAIQQNAPLHSQQNLLTNSLLYPMAVPPLDTGKIYAWQVAAKSSNNAISKSEIWTFKLRQDVESSESVGSTASFIPLVNKNDAAYSTLSGDLRFEFLNEINDTSVAINYYDITGTSRAVIGTDTAFKKIHFGQNFLVIPREEMPALINKHIYLFEMINSKLERWYLKFEYRKPENN